MIRVRYLRSFDKSFLKLPRQDRACVQRAVSRLLDYFAGGPRPLGLGLRDLGHGFWEVRASIELRILFLLEHDLATFVLAGDHNDIRRRSHGG